MYLNERKSSGTIFITVQFYSIKQCVHSLNDAFQNARFNTLCNYDVSLLKKTSGGEEIT